MLTPLARWLQVWLTVGFFTAFLWVPVVLLATTLFTAVAAVVAVRFLSLPRGQALLNKVWQKISSSPTGKKVFYYTPKPVVMQGKA